MTQGSVGLVLGLMLATGVSAGMAEEAPKKLTPQQRKEIRAQLLEHNRAGLRHYRAGQLVAATAAFEKAVTAARQLYPPAEFPNGHADLAMNLGNLGAMLQVRGKYADAEPLFREALRMYRRLHAGKDHADLASHMSYLVSALANQNKFAEAESVCRETLEMTRRLYPRQDRVEVASSLNNLASELNQRGKYADAEPLIRECLEMTRRLPNRHSLALRLTNLAWSLAGQGRCAEADPLFREGLQTCRASSEAYAAVASEGEALTLAASLPLARDFFLSNARMLRSDAETVYREVWSSKASLARVYERRALAARAASANPRAAALLTTLTQRRRRRAGLLLAPRPTDAASREKRDTDLAQFAREIETLDRELRPLLPAIDRAEKLARSLPADLRKVLPADAAVVDFLHYNLIEAGKDGAKRTESYLAFVLHRDKVAWIDLGLARPIETAITAWRERITSGEKIAPALPARVRELVWSKVRKEIPAGVKVVYVCPDLTLCRLPWAALPGDRPDSILLEDHAIAIVPHAAFLLDKLWSRPPLARRPAEALVVGGVAYDADTPLVGAVALDRGKPPLPGGKVAWEALPGTAAEARGMAALAARKRLALRSLVGEKGTSAAVLAALPQARSAHLATHGFFADASFRSALQVDPGLFEMSRHGERIGAGALSPLVMTGLVLAGANRPGTPGRGIVTGEALVDVDLSGLELAVLSACETGLGDVAGGEGTFGLQRAFHLAGTRDVVASLWKVSDQATAALMALFYRNLWEKDLSPVEALRQAQLAVYRSSPKQIRELAVGFRGKVVEVSGKGKKPPVEGKAHPHLWAAFTLSGPGR
jgi:CHAT domain-containing protein/tetratricopeptide (TPR) repeat protein